MAGVVEKMKLYRKSIIRFANNSDARDIAICHILSWQKIYRGLIPDNILDNLSIQEGTQRWQNHINNDVKVLVIDFDQKIVGIASICPSRDKDTNPKECGEISAIYLLPDVWHRGLGKKLCMAAISELEKMGFNEVIIWVLKENHQARKFYRSMGFNETGHTKRELYDKDVTLFKVRYQKYLI